MNSPPLSGSRCAATAYPGATCRQLASHCATGFPQPGGLATGRRQATGSVRQNLQNVAPLMPMYSLLFAARARRLRVNMPGLNEFLEALPVSNPI